MDEHELYGVPRERFIAERDAWAKALRADGRRDEAAEVAALRKPTVAASAVNQLVRTESHRLGVLLDAGDALRAAQDRMLSGPGTAAELRDAVERERAAVDALVSIAARAGATGAVSERVAGTLHAAALDEDARVQVCRGRLVDELQHVGFGGESPGAAPAPRPPARKRSKPEQPDRAEQRRLTEERTNARRAELETRRRLQRAERILSSAEQQHAAAQTALRDAEGKLAAARAEAEDASAAHDAAERALDALQSGGA